MLSIVDRLCHVDADKLGWWLCERQLPSGGLNGNNRFISTYLIIRYTLQATIVRWSSGYCGSMFFHWIQLLHIWDSGSGMSACMQCFLSIVLGEWGGGCMVAIGWASFPPTARGSGECCKILQHPQGQFCEFIFICVFLCKLLTYLGSANNFGAFLTEKMHLEICLGFAKNIK